MIRERDLSVYLDRWMRENHPRVLRPAFQGTITSFTRKTTGTGAVAAGTYLCRLQRTNETVGDGMEYPVLGDYVPVAGDVVECWWRDDAVAFVLGPLLPQRAKYRAHVTWPSGAQVDASGAWTKIPYSTVAYDPAGMFRAATSDFLIPFDAVWRFSCYGMDNGTAAGIVVAMWLTRAPGAAAELRRFLDVQRNASGNSGGGGAVTVELLKGDVVDGRIFNRDGGNHNIVPGSHLDYATLDFVSGLS